MRTGLLLDDADLKRIREKMEACSWASSGYRRLRVQAEEVFITARPSPGMLDAVEAAAIVYAISGEKTYAERAGARIRSCESFPEIFGALRSDTYNFGCNTLLTGH